MANATKRKAKKRAEKYDTKLAINGTFEDDIKVMVTSMRDLKEQPKKK